MHFDERVCFFGREETFLFSIFNIFPNTAAGRNHEIAMDDITFREPEPTPSRWNRRVLGFSILFVVNILWVLASELLRYVFVEEGFHRPYCVSYLKNTMLSVYILKYLLKRQFPEQREKEYKFVKLQDMDVDSLSVEGYETMTSSDTESVVNIRESPIDREPENSQAIARRVSFARHREVRRMPSSEALDAQRARRPYNPAECTITCSWTIERHIKWTVFFFAPMWLVCSFTYQTALAFTSVSSLNLISSSSSLFVLVFAICIPVAGQKFTLFKAFLVALNLSGVALVSEFSMSLMGATFAQVSAVAYALYLTAYARFQEKFGTLDIDFMFGTMGLVTVVLGTPLLFALDAAGVEPMFPLPNQLQLISIVSAGFFGTLLADYLWLLGAGMTDSLTASLSMTLSIPFAFLADTVLRGRPPSLIQLIAAIPITLSFVGAAIVEGRKGPSQRVLREVGPCREQEDREELLAEEPGSD